LGLIARLFGISMFPVFVPRWLKKRENQAFTPPSSVHAWLDVNLAKIPIGALLLIIVASMVKLTLNFFTEDGDFYWYLFTLLWIVFTVASFRVGLKHFFRNPLSYL
ncbi:hypothetical protein JKG47_20525, partial [Acidithiobacillus sp. MC6.1]|nr:hypothetical protein [Acidithiobacillus sp. MC6.1]